MPQKTIYIVFELVSGTPLEETPRMEIFTSRKKAVSYAQSRADEYSWIPEKEQVEEKDGETVVAYIEDEYVVIIAKKTIRI